MRSGFFKGIRGFDHFEKKVAALPETERGDAFEVFVEAWLNVVRKAKDVLPALSITPSLHKKLGLPRSRQEVGWDGVFTDGNGEQVVYQAKYRTGRKTLTWTELSTFFASTERSPYRCVITNADGVTKIASDRKHYFVIAKSELKNLSKSDFTSIAGWLKGAKTKVRKFTPRPYQKKAIKEICAELKKADRTQAIMACGTGKTLVAKWINDSLKAKRCLVLLPSLALVRQTIREWSVSSDLKDTVYICVCSEEGITKGIDELSFRLSDLEFPVTTGVDELKALLSKNAEKRIVVFSTYHSSSVVGSAMGRKIQFDLGIFDEAHKTVSKRKTNFSYALSDENIKIKKRLFLTATPRKINVRKKDRYGEFDVSSMDDPSIYGERSHRLLFPDAVKQGIICDYRVIISVVTNKEVNRSLITQGEVRIESDLVRAQQVAHQIALKNAIQRFKLKKVFSFHGSIRAAKSFVAEGSEGIRNHVKNLDCFHVNGSMTSALREAVLGDFAQSAKGLISNARCLTEGVNLPSVDCVSFIDPRKSQVDIVQATGRAMRKALHTKKYGYIFIPLYVEQQKGETAEEAVERSDYAQIADVLNAMREHDNDLEETITAIGVARGENPKGSVRGGFLGEKVRIIGPSVGIECLEKAIKTKLVDRLIASWDFRFGELRAFHRTKGHCLVKQSFPANPSLGAWVTDQRVRRNKGVLSRERINRLDQLDFVWDVDEYFWTMMFTALVAYDKEHGHTVVPHIYQENPQLGHWVFSQRQSRIKGSLADEKVKKLDSLDFVWDPNQYFWDIRLTELTEFKMVHGHCRVPAKYKKNRKLGTWVDHQRFLQLNNQLPKDKFEILDSLGFDWDPRKSDWDENYSALTLYRKKNGHCRVTQRDDPQLDRWLGKRRSENNRGKLEEDRIKALDALNFDWHPDETIWNERFEELTAFREVYGHCRVPQKYISNKALGTWVSGQRSRRSKGELPGHKIKKLDEIGFDWNPDQTVWQVRFEELKAFRKVHGHCRVPRGFSENPKLITWVQEQRTVYKRGKLSEDKISRLENIGFDWDPYETLWNEMYEELRIYDKKKGDCNVPQNFPENQKLGFWIATQREYCRKGKLPKDKIEKLEELGFDWDPKVTEWETSLSALKLFKRKEGNCRVSHSQNSKLARWLIRLRRAHKKGKLPIARYKALNEMGVDWDPEETQWMEMFCQLQAFHKLHGHCSVNRSENPSLNVWIYKQKAKRKNGTLSKDKIKKLDEMGFVWDT